MCSNLIIISLSPVLNFSQGRATPLLFLALAQDRAGRLESGICQGLNDLVVNAGVLDRRWDLKTQNGPSFPPQLTLCFTLNGFPLAMSDNVPLAVLPERVLGRPGTPTDRRNAATGPIRPRTRGTSSLETSSADFELSIIYEKI